jgi:hypothetical protein
MPKDRTLAYRMRNSSKKKSLTVNEELPPPSDVQKTPLKLSIKEKNNQKSILPARVYSRPTFKIDAKLNLENFAENEKMLALIKFIVNVHSQKAAGYFANDQVGFECIKKFHSLILEKVEKVNQEYFEEKTKKMIRNQELNKQKKKDFKVVFDSLSAVPRYVFENYKKIKEEAIFKGMKSLELRYFLFRVLEMVKSPEVFSQNTQEPLQVTLPLDKEFEALVNTLEKKVKNRQKADKISTLVEYSKQAFELIEKKKKLRASEALESFGVFNLMFSEDPLQGLRSLSL